MGSRTNKTVHEQLRKWRRCDDVEGLRRRVYRALRIAEAIAYAPESTNAERLKACTVMQQTARTYLAVLEADDLEERVKALEEAAEQRTSGKANGSLHYN